jgi:hypothetical protein
LINPFVSEYEISDHLMITAEVQIQTNQLQK